MGMNFVPEKFWNYYNDRMEVLKRGTLLGMVAVQVFYLVISLGATGVLSVFFLLIPFKYPVLTPVYVIYAMWWWYDLDTPSTGGRPLKYCYLRRWKLFKVLQKYYPITLIKTASLDPQRNYIFGYHPHGMVPDGAVVSFCTEFAGFTRLFPGIYTRLSTLSAFNYFAVFRELELALGLISVSRKSLEYALTQKGPGHSVVIAIGGSTEVLSTTPSTYYLTLNQRKGFARLALETGSSLVPVFAFGQNDLFHQPRTIFSPKIESWLSKWFKIIAKYSFLAYHDRPTFGITPRPTPIHVIVGEPLHVTKVPNPTQQQINNLHGEYVAKLLELFESHKGKYGKDTSLVLLDRSN